MNKQISCCNATHVFRKRKLITENLDTTMKHEEPREINAFSSARVDQWRHYRFEAGWENSAELGPTSQHPVKR